MRLLTSIAAATIALTFPLAAHADEPSPEPAPAEPAPSAPAAPIVVASAEDSRAGLLGPVLDGYADEDRTSRVVRGVAGLALGAAEIPLGIYMSGKDEKGPGYFVIAVGAGSALGGTLAFFAESPMARLASSYRDGLAQGRPASEVVERTERQWSESAHRERLWRKVFGITGLAVGAVTIGAGVTLALVSTPSEMSVREQQGFATALIGLGHVTALGGLWSLVHRGTVESSYDLYMRATGRPAALSERLRFGAAPLARGGGMATLGLSF
jgi:hypothetical protein